MKKMLAGFALFIFMIFLTAQYFDWNDVRHSFGKLINHPFWLISMFFVYGLAFVFRAWAWKQYLNRPLSLGVYLAGLFYSLLFNHLLPVKAGDGLRVYVLMQKKVEWDEAVHSVLVMRTLDLLMLGLIAGTVAFIIGFSVSVTYFVVLVMLVVLMLCSLYFLSRKKGWGFIGRHLALLKKALKGRKGIAVSSFVLISWLLEAVVVIGVVQASGWQLPVAKAVWVNSMTIAGQMFQMTPGGIGSYESVMSVSLVHTGFTWKDAYTVALMTHGFKFAFSYLAGFYIWMVYPLQWQEIRQWIKKKGTKA